MPRAFIGIGSNINPENSIMKALKILSEHINITRISKFYLTQAIYHPEQPEYYNGIVEVYTNIPPTELKLEVLRKIEAELGRTRSEDKYAPRAIDLDLLIYDDLVIKSDTLTIPDPRITDRPFLAIPLAELASDMLLPGTNQSLREIADRFSNNEMKALDDFTRKLQMEITDEL